MATVLWTNLVHNKLGSSVMVQKYAEGLSSGMRATLGLERTVHQSTARFIFLYESFDRAHLDLAAPPRRNLKIVIQKGIHRCWLLCTALT